MHHARARDAQQQQQQQQVELLQGLGHPRQPADGPRQSPLQPAGQAAEQLAGDLAEQPLELADSASSDASAEVDRRRRRATLDLQVATEVPRGVIARERIGQRVDLPAIAIRRPS